MAFRTIHTLYGLTRLAQAEAAGSTINLPHMAVGDGNGNPVTPAESQTTLVRERYRAAVNRVYQDPATPNKFSAELVIPASVGGFTLREVGLFDAAGALFVTGNLPDTYKPEADEGAFSDTVVRVDFMVSNAATVEIIADPNVVLVTQQWISNNVTAATLIPGGTVGQLLGKASNADGDYQWQDPDAINVTVDTVAEKQLLAAGQTIVDLSVTTTYGLAVYIEGLRIDIGSGADEWQAHPTISTRLTLGKSYPADTRITLVNNEPAGSAPAPLERDKNFADLQSKDTARTNLSVYSKAEVDQRVRNPGDIFYTAAATAPPFSLKANGAAVSRTAYAKLFARIGTRYGAGDGFTTFNLPDLRGEFLRGWDDGRGVDGGRELGSWQDGALQSHAHSGSAADAGAHAHSGTAQSGGSHSHNASTGTAGAHSHSKTYQYVAGGALNHGFVYNNPDIFHGGGDSISAGGPKIMHTNQAGAHAHSVSIGTAGAHEHNLTINSAGTHNHAITVAATGGAETRPRNLAMLACIAF